jgi:hypothetical protein
MKFRNASSIEIKIFSNTLKIVSQFFYKSLPLNIFKGLE